MACYQSGSIVFGLVRHSRDGYTVAGHVQSFWQALGRQNDFIPPPLRRDITAVAWRERESV